MKEYTIWIVESKGDVAKPYLSANPHSIDEARKIAYGLLKKLGPQYYISMTGGTMSHSPYTSRKSPNTGMIVWTPFGNNTAIYAVSPKGKITPMR